MYAHALTYPAVPVRRSIRTRRRAVFFVRMTTQHVRTVPWSREIARAALALLNVAVWALLIFAL